MIYDDEEVMDTEIIDDAYQDGVDFEDYNDLEEEEEDDGSDEFDEDSDRSLKTSRFVGDANKYKFFQRECAMYEFSRTPVSFTSKKDGSDYKGIVLKELDKTHFVFLVDSESGNPKKMKKVDITDISVYF